MKSFLRVGEFANLCRTTKDTLLHYSRKGILKPKTISGNGYRYYCPEQFWEFGLLALLKETGSSLSEIMEARTKNGQSYFELIKGKLGELVQHRDKLTQRIGMLNQLVALTEEALCSPLDVPIFVENQAQLVRYHKINTDDMSLSLSNPEVYSECLKKELELGNSVYPPLGLVVSAKDAENGNLRVSYLFFKCDEPDLHDSKLVESGQYIKMIHYGDMASHRECFRKLVYGKPNKMLSSGGDVLIYDQMNFLIETDESHFWGKYMIKNF